MTQSKSAFTSAPKPIGPAYAAPIRHGNSAAVASLVMGVLGGIPFLPATLAILCAIIGLRKARNPAIGGKGLAITGLTLGLASILFWLGVAGFLFYGSLEGRPGGVVAEQFLKDVAAGNSNAAMANSSGLAPAQLKAEGDQMSQYGTLQGVAFNSPRMYFSGGQKLFRLGGVATFSKGPRNCTCTVAKEGPVFKVVGYQVQ